MPVPVVPTINEIKPDCAIVERLRVRVSVADEPAALLSQTMIVPRLVQSEPLCRVTLAIVPATGLSAKIRRLEPALTWALLLKVAVTEDPLLDQILVLAQLN